jgi:hypothetical protein
MTRLFVAAAAMVMLSVPAMAQMSSGTADSDMNSMKCSAMIDKANSSMTSMTDDAKKGAMIDELKMARASMMAHDEPTCREHAKKALQMT